MVKPSLLGALLLALGATARPINPRRPVNCRRGGTCVPADSTGGSTGGTDTSTDNSTDTTTGTTTVAFNEQFSSSSLSSWIKDTGHKYNDPRAPDNWGTGEIQSYDTSSDVLRVSGGYLTIKPLKGSNGQWRSARIETSDTFTPQAGKTFRAEARIKLGSASKSQQAGIWPAFWMLGADYRTTFDWPTIGEIDILESVNGEAREWNVAHCATCDEPNGVGSSSSMSRGTWHVLRFEIKRSSSANNWRTETLSWYLDGSLKFQIKGSDINSQSSWSALAHASRFVILNVAVGGSFPDALWGSTTPTSNTITTGSGTEMQVDYVKVGHVEDGLLW